MLHEGVAMVCVPLCQHRVQSMPEHGAVFPHKNGFPPPRVQVQAIWAVAMTATAADGALEAALALKTRAYLDICVYDTARFLAERLVALVRLLPAVEAE